MSASPTVNVSATEIPASPSMSFTCHTCKCIFENSATQRAHFKTDLHITNVKRQVRSWSSEHAPFEDIQAHSSSTARTDETSPDTPTGNASISEQQADDRIVGSHENMRKQRNEDVDDLPNSSTDCKGKAQCSEDLHQQLHITAGSTRPDLVIIEDEEEEIACPTFDPSMCLFCVHCSSGLDGNIIHMQTAHGLSIPEQSRLIHLESFIHYLFTIIFEFNECISCAVTKGSAKAVQQHMLTKGHCKISDHYRDFYDLSGTEDEEEEDLDVTNTKYKSVETENLAKSTEDYVRLSSGKTLGSRLTVRGPRKISHQIGHGSSRGDEATSTNDVSTILNVEGSEALPRPRGLQMTRTSDSKALVGVPEWQKRALRATERNIQQFEIRAKKRYEAAVQRAADERPDLRRRRVTRVPDSV